MSGTLEEVIVKERSGVRLPAEASPRDWYLTWMTDETLDAIRSVVFEHYQDQYEDFISCSKEAKRNHIFQDLKRVAHWYESDPPIPTPAMVVRYLSYVLFSFIGCEMLVRFADDIFYFFNLIIY